MALSQQARALRDALERSEENTRLLRPPRLRDRRLRPPRSGILNQVNNLLTMSALNIEEEFRQLMGTYSYRSKLKILFQQSETGTETKSQLADVITKIMQSLQNNLNEKSKQYKDPALSHIFLMNNLHYMVMSVRRSQTKDILGDDWIQRHRKIVQQNASQYKRVAWAGVSVSSAMTCIYATSLFYYLILHTLTIQTTGGPGSPTPPVVITSGVSRNRIKERSLVQRGKNPHKYIKHSPEALDQLLGQFFQGLQVGEQKR
nr:unnamed protein product [Digitaria exilis]